MVNRYRSSDQFITSIDFDSIANAGGKVQLVAARARTSRIKFSSTSRSTRPISFTAADCEADPNNRMALSSSARGYFLGHAKQGKLLRGRARGTLHIEPRRFRNRSVSHKRRTNFRRPECRD